MFGTIVLLLLLLLLVVTWPVWPYSRGWGYFPAGGVAVLLAILLILAYGGLLAIRNPLAGS